VGRRGQELWALTMLTRAGEKNNNETVKPAGIVSTKRDCGGWVFTSRTVEGEKTSEVGGRREIVERAPGRRQTSGRGKNFLAAGQHQAKRGVPSKHFQGPILPKKREGNGGHDEKTNSQKKPKIGGGDSQRVSVLRRIKQGGDGKLGTGDSINPKNRKLG